MDRTDRTPDSPDSPGTDHWLLRHPTLGDIEVVTGTADALGTVDPGFPGAPGRTTAGTDDPTGDSGDSGGTGDSGTVGDSDGGTAGRSTARRARRDSRSPGSPRLLVRIDGTVVARCRSLADVKIDLSPDVLTDPAKHPGTGEYGHPTAISAPMLVIGSDWSDRWVRAVTLKAGGDVVEFDAPAGSRAEKRQQGMERSAVKRWLYPVLGGIGKGGWALAVLVLGPLLARILDPLWRRLASLLPDWHVDWPEIPWPHVDWPEITLPSVPWPDIDWPTVHLPWIVDLALDYTKVWVPVLLGIGVGVTAVRNGRRSREKKAQWRERERERTAARVDAARTDLARAMRAVVDRGGADAPRNRGGGEVTPDASSGR